MKGSGARLNRLVSERQVRETEGRQVRETEGRQVRIGNGKFRACS